MFYNVWCMCRAKRRTFKITAKTIWHGIYTVLVTVNFMKLIFCTECKSIFSLSYDKKTCDCEKSWGNYKSDGVQAEYGGNAIPLGFANGSFRHALTNQPNEGNGYEFRAFVIPKKCGTFFNCN